MSPRMKKQEPRPSHATAFSFGVKGVRQCE